MAKVTDKRVAEMAAKCGWGTEKCRAALVEHGGTVDATLLKLIEAGKITLKQLNEELVSQKLLAEARTQEAIRDMQRSMTKYGVNVDSKLWNEMVEKIRKTPELPGFIKATMEDQKRERNRPREKSVKLNMRPFGKLKFDESAWKGEIKLKTWGQYGAGGFEGGLLMYQPPGNGLVSLDVFPPGDGEEATEPSAEQAAAVEYLLENEEAITAAVLSAIFEEYPNLRDAYASHCESYGLILPELKKPEEVMRLVYFQGVNLLNVAKKGMAYVGFGFACEWDNEHGLGVMTHGKRVIGVGVGEDSFLEGSPLEDGGKKL